MAEEENHHDGPVAARISQSAVQLMREYTGRGPTKASTTINSELVVIILRNGMTKTERSLIAKGEEEVVLHLRRKFQRAIREDMVEIVEQQLDRRVVAFMSDYHIDPDVAVETFILEPQDADSSAAA
jgi:uncharacterized protein YbcI